MPAPTFPTEQQRSYGRLRRDCWSSGILSGGRDIPLDRWENVGADSENLIALLGEPATSLAARLPAPAWLEPLRSAWQRFSDPTDDEQLTTDPLAGPILPLLRWSRHQLLDQVRTLDPAAADPAHPIFQPPVKRLVGMITPTLTLEVNVAREQGELTADTSDRGFAEFVTALSNPARGLEWLSEYPVLAEQLVTAVLHWVHSRAEFVARYLRDLPLLANSFGLTAAGIHDLRQVRFDAGDSHRDGRTVAILTFIDDRRLVYKPRSVRAERCYNDLLRELGSHLTHRLKDLRVLDRDGYGWVEYAEPAPCTTTTQVERFFWRQGAYLALFHALCGSDLHHENVLACGEHPVIVDVEALFQATPRMFGLADTEPLSSVAVRTARDSVLRVGLLPDHVIRTGERGAYGTDISGLTGGAGQLSLVPVTVVHEAGTDRMRLARERRPLPPSSNQARLEDRGDPVDVADFREHVIEGFACCYRALLRHRDQLASEDGLLDRFRGAEVRTLLRPTASYARLLGESWHPDLLRDALDREYLLESLAVAMQGVDVADQLVDSEVRQLVRQDIPFFSTTVDSVDLFDDDGVLIPGFFERSGLEAVRDRVRGLSEPDLARQIWLIEASMTGMRLGEFEPRRQAATELPTGQLEQVTAIDAALVVGDRLLEMALDDEHSPTPSWLSIAFTGDRYWKVAPTGADLYGGLAGIGLFLAELDAVAPAAGFRQPADRIAGYLCDLTDYLSEQQLLVPTLGGGGMTGVPGLSYLFFELGSLWDRPDLVERARSLAIDGARACREDRQNDLVTGAAGTALVYAGMHRELPDERTLAAVRAARDTLLDQVIETDPGTACWPADMETRRPLLGLAHGSSGVALALAGIADLTGDQRCADLVLAALRHERGGLSRTHGNWPDLRSFVAPETYRDTWCHGATGIGLARTALASAECVANSAEARRLVDEDLRIAADTMRRDLIGRAAGSDEPATCIGLGNDSLCHGDPSLLGTLRAAAPILRRPELAELGGRAGQLVAERVLAGDLRCGTPDGLVTPGLLVGLAGIGYGLLRLAMPDQLPDVLLLESLGSVRPVRETPG